MDASTPKMSAYSRRDSKKKDLFDTKLGYLEMKYHYYMLKIGLLYLYEKSRDNPETCRLMDKLYNAIETGESCLVNIDCDLQDVIQDFESYPDDGARLEWFERYIMNT